MSYTKNMQVKHGGKHFSIKIVEKEDPSLTDFIRFDYNDAVIRDDFSVDMPIDFDLMARFYDAFRFVKDAFYRSSEYGFDLRKAVKHFKSRGVTLDLVPFNGNEISSNDEYFCFELFDSETGFKTNIMSNTALGRDCFSIEEGKFAGCPIEEKGFRLFKNNVETGEIHISLDYVVDENAHRMQ